MIVIKTSDLSAQTHSPLCAERFCDGSSAYQAPELQCPPKVGGVKKEKKKEEEKKSPSEDPWFHLQGPWVKTYPSIL